MSKPVLVGVKKYRLSRRQQLALQDMAAGLDPWARIHGQAQHGGFTCTIHSLQRRGMIDWDGAITDKGRRAAVDGFVMETVP